MRDRKSYQSYLYSANNDPRVREVCLKAKQIVLWGNNICWFCSPDGLQSGRKEYCVKYESPSQDKAINEGHGHIYHSVLHVVRGMVRLKRSWLYNCCVDGSIELITFVKINGCILWLFVDPWDLCSSQIQRRSFWSKPRFLLVSIWLNIVAICTSESLIDCTTGDQQ